MNPFRCSLVWATIWAIAIASITSCAHTPAFAPILGTEIFIEGDEREVAFDVPEAGNAILRVVNAAKIYATPDQRLAGAKIILNGQPVVSPETFNEQVNLLKIPVRLQQGDNRLGVRLEGKPGQRLSVRIDAPADAIRLEPIADTLMIGGSFQAEVKVTGLGRPVRDAQIALNVGGLGDIPQSHVKTDTTGTARTTVTGYQLAGTGKLTASTDGLQRVLSNTVPIRVVVTPSIKLGQSVSKTRIEAGSERRVSFTIDFLKDDSKTYHIVFEQIVESDRGIDVQTTGVPSGGFSATGPSTFVIKGTIEGKTPGTYTLTSRATVKETGATVSARTEVKVVEPQPTEEILTLGPPHFVPAAITVATNTAVRFAATVTGVKKPPAFLELQEFDPQRGWVPVSQLFDDGLNGDMIAGNLVYARRINVTGAQEGDKRYRVVGSQNGETVVSGLRTLEVSRFFVGSDPNRPDFVEDTTTGHTLVAERVVVSVLPSVSPARIEEIVERVTREVTGQAGKVNGYTRQINVYRVELVLDPLPDDAARVAAVKAAVAEFKTYDEVRYAHPNFRVEFAQVLPDGDSSGICSITGNAAGQWGVWKIQAPEAWALTGGTGSGGTKTVAVIDSGVKADHLDLTGKVIGTADDLFDVSAKTGGHGTKVAGIIAATHNSGGISGIAHGLPVSILSFKVGGSFSDDETVRDKIFAAADMQDVGVINISTESVGLMLEAWECALQYATYPPDTPVGFICDGTSRGGSNGQGKLVVVAAGNIVVADDYYGRDIGGNPPQYPCAYNLDGVLCVANTDAADKLGPHSNYGAEADGMDLTAPGTDICTTARPDNNNNNQLYGHSGGPYTGTSYAAPHVSGAAAVLWSMVPGLTAQEVATRLKLTADSIDSVNPVAMAGKLGSGRLNMATAIDYVVDPDLTMIGGSQPYLSGGSWSSIDQAQAQPAKGGLVLAYEQPSHNLDAYPLSTAGATVTLRPGAVPNAVISCSGGPPPSPLGPADLGSCFFQLQGNKIYISYLGNLKAGEEIAYTVSGLTAADPSFTVADFDSAGIGGPLIPTAGRDPARLVLVLDKSGSMAWSSHPADPGCGVHAPPPPGCGPSRREVLDQAVSQMLAVAEPYALLDDRFAVAFFDSNVSPGDRFDFAGFSPAIDSFVSNPGRISSGSTSIGAGVTEFETELTAASASSYHQTILLFTDGDQNRQPYLVEANPQVLINPSANSATGPGVHEFAPGMVDICPFALQADNLPGTNYLETIASLRCGGLMNSAIDINPSETELVEFFLQVLHDAIIGDKLELVQVTSGQIRRREKISASETFTTSREDVAFTVLINWVEAENGLKKVVLSKDGVNFPVTGAPNRIHTSSGDSYMAITLRRPYCRHDGKCVESEGEWKLHLQPSFGDTNKFTYNVFVSADNATLASEFNASQPEPGVGKPLKLTASLTDAGKPIKGLPTGSVRAFISRPKSSLGNVLAKARVRPIQNPDADPINAAGLKATAMLADPRLRATILDAIQTSVETELILRESKPGLYEATYHDTRVAGNYRVRFEVKGNSPINGNFTRSFTSVRYVEVIADAPLTLKTTRVSSITPCDLAGGCYSITLTPVDVGGNLLGPGKASLINITKFPGQLLEPISDGLDGRYTVRIGYPEPRTENPVIEIQGIKIPVTELPSGLNAACRKLLVGSACSSNQPCVSLRYLTGSANGATSASNIARALQVEEITFTGPRAAPLLSDVGSLACVGWRSDIGGTPTGAQCLSDLLGSPFQIQNRLPTRCNFDGFRYEVVAE